VNKGKGTVEEFMAQEPVKQHGAGGSGDRWEVGDGRVAEHNPD